MKTQLLFKRRVHHDAHKYIFKPVYFQRGVFRCPECIKSFAFTLNMHFTYFFIVAFPMALFRNND